MERQDGPARLHVHRVGIDAHHEAILYLHQDNPVCRSEGFRPMTRVRVIHDGHEVVADVHIVTSDLIRPQEAGLSEAAWAPLGVEDGNEVQVRHLPPPVAMRHVRKKIWGHRLDAPAFKDIVHDVVTGHLGTTQVAAFLSSTAGDRLDLDETVELTRAMVAAGERLSWPSALVADKHSVGGLPGNRTTPLVVPIVAAAGLCMPKTSSKAITSPAGTADMLATVTRPELSVAELREVVEKEGGCMAWGGAIRLSPADDLLIRVERTLDLDSEGQMVASILSKKIAAGSTHVVIDMPVGPSAKVRDESAARSLRQRLEEVGRDLGLHVAVVESDGIQPVGRGLGPALEARDVLSVLRNEKDAPADLRERALDLAGAILDLADVAEPGHGRSLARKILADGRALRKFEAICRAQGRFEEPPVAAHTHVVEAHRAGTLVEIDNRRLALVAKLAGAPDDPAAGLDLHVRLGQEVHEGDALFTLHAESPGELEYALEHFAREPELLHIRALD